MEDQEDLTKPSLCQGCEISYMDSIEYSKEQVISFLVNHGVAIKSMICPECGYRMKLYIPQEEYRCYGHVSKNKQKRGKCNFSKSMWSQTIFHQCRLTKCKVFRLIGAAVWLVPSLRVTAVQQEVSKQKPDWFLTQREVFIDAVSQNSKKLGGKDQVVELAEAKWNAKDPKENLWDWAFGGIDRQSGETFLVPVECHSIESLREIIDQKINPGTIIVTNCTKSLGLTVKEIKQLSNSFSVSFEPPRCSRISEVMKHHWNEVCKGDWSKSISNKSRPLSIDQLAEYLFKSKHPVQSERMHAFFVAAGRLYPPGKHNCLP